MARHSLLNPVRPRSQMSGAQRKKASAKKSARAIAASHRRQADASYDAMLEAQDDAWEGGEYQGNYAYDAYQNPRMETINVVVDRGGKTAAELRLKADVDALWDDLTDEYRDETDRLWLTVRGKMSGGPSRASMVRFDWPHRTLTFYTTRSNPFMVTPRGQAIGSHDRPTHTHLRGAALDAHEAKVARGATILEREGIRLHIKQVGNEYRIFDDRGNDMQKFAYSLDKARAILEKMIASQQ